MRWARLGVVLALVATSSPAAAGPPGARACPIFPRTNVWHADISRLPVHPRSNDWIDSMGGPSERLHPDFGPSGESMPYGIPYEVVRGDHPKTAIDFLYDDESDAGPYPFDSDTPIESGSDRHAIMLDADRCILYELFDARYSPGGSSAGSGAIFDLRSNKLRPATWTSADAAGLPIFAGLVRLDEVEAGRIDHAIRVTASRTRDSFVWPARHQAGHGSDPALPPMGARFRLKRSFDLGGFRADTRVILRAMKTYGLILADNGSDWFFTGTAEHGWKIAMLDELKTVPASAFEAVDLSGLRAARSSGRVRAKVRIARVRPDVERVVIVNKGTNPINLHNWTVRSDSGPVYRFGRLVMKPRARVVLHTGRGTDRPGHRFWGRPRPAWSDGGGLARLHRPDGSRHHRLAY